MFMKKEKLFMTECTIPAGFQVHKYHALGNDYLVIDPAEYSPCLTEDLIRLLCDRNRGVGSDGILFGPLADFSGQPWKPAVQPPAPFHLRIFNPDGSEAEKSGNGLRIFALYCRESGRAGRGPFSVITKGGPVECRVDYPEPGFITVSMGKPEFSASRIGLSPEAIAQHGERLIAVPFHIDGLDFSATCVSMGNPHCVLHGRKPDRELALRIGPQVERHPWFPNRTNVQFLEVLDRCNIRIEIWERGAGYTLASGSSSCAAAAAAYALDLVDSRITVHMPGGRLAIDMSGESINMSGPAVRVFDAILAPGLQRAHVLNRSTLDGCTGG